jgi:hypothetical protein
VTTLRDNALVEDYLRRLYAAAAHLPSGRRKELAREIRAHIQEAGAEDETAVRDVLERRARPRRSPRRKRRRPRDGWRTRPCWRSL